MTLVICGSTDAMTNRFSIDEDCVAFMQRWRKAAWGIDYARIMEVTLVNGKKAFIRTDTIQKVVED